MRKPWYKNGVMYAVDLRTFQDSDGDGIGDFKGLCSRLDYLAELGVTCLWLLPFYPTPFRDNGYDVQYYFAIDSHLGGFDEFLHLREQAEKRGMQVIIDLVMNHTSNQHPWFLAAQRDPQSCYHNYYVWSEKPHQVPKEQQTIFPGAEDDVWTYSDPAGKYYYHRFYHFEPQLNGQNPAVREELCRVLDFWLALGVAGFRVDAAAHLIENTGAEAEQKVVRDYEFFSQLYRLVAQRRKDVFLMGEADVDPHELDEFFGNGQRLTLLLNFLLSQHLFLALATESSGPIVRLERELPSRPAQAQWVNFLRNLDELDLERLNKEEQQQVFRAFAPEESMQVYGRGIRRRAAPMFSGDRRRIELAYSLLFAQPGIPVIIYGDEIGMGENLDQPQRDAVRAPMQWSDAQNAGFSLAPSERLLRPVIADGPFSYREVNVAAQRNNADSLLNWMRQLIAVRKRCPALGESSLTTLETGVKSLLAQTYEDKDEMLLLVHNLAGRASTTSLGLGDLALAEPQLIFGRGELRLLEDKRAQLDLPPYGYCWYRLAPG